MNLFSLFSLFITTKIDNVKRVDLSNPPACKECIYFQPNQLSSEYGRGRCKKFLQTNYPNDKCIYEYADVCRTDPTKCGIRANEFERRCF